jgi:hypothetical protein
MIGKTIAYEDYNGNQRKETFFFHLSKAELMEMELVQDGGMEQMIQRIIDTQDRKRIVEIFKEIILKAYGEKSLDGKRFEKIRDGKRLADDFAQTEAYSILFMELATDSGAATAFINGVMPQGLAAEAAERSRHKGLESGT